MHLFDNIYYYEGVGLDSNVYVIDEKDSALMIDTGTGKFITYLIEGMKDDGISPKKVNIILNTHAHFDHIGGDPKLNGSKIYAHKIDAPYIETFDPKYTLSYKKPERKLNVLVLDDKFKLGKRELKIIHTPGHTKGSICIYDKSTKTLFSGDTVFAEGQFGRVDLAGGNMKDMIKSISKLEKIDVKNLLPGHSRIVLDNGNEHIKKAYKVAKKYESKKPTKRIKVASRKESR